MKIQAPTITILNAPTQEEALARVIEAARNCYQSYDRSAPESDEKLVKHLLSLKHGAIFEQVFIQMAIELPRGIHLEWVRHRTGQSHAAESSRYNAYNRSKFGGELTYIYPLFTINNDEAYVLWAKACISAEDSYMKLLAQGYQAQEAATVLNNSLKIRDVITANFRGLMDFFNLRCPSAAHPEMRRCSLALLDYCADKYPIFFGWQREKFDNEYDLFESRGWPLAVVSEKISD